MRHKPFSVNFFPCRPGFFGSKSQARRTTLIDQMHFEGTVALDFQCCTALRTIDPTSLSRRLPLRAVNPRIRPQILNLMPETPNLQPSAQSPEPCLGWRPGANWLLRCPVSQKPLRWRTSASTAFGRPFRVPLKGYYKGTIRVPLKGYHNAL